MKLTVSPKAIVAFVQVVEPATPTAGGVQVKVAVPSCVNEMKVVFGSVLSVKETLVASSGPWLVTKMR